MNGASPPTKPIQSIGHANMGILAFPFAPKQDNKQMLPVTEKCHLYQAEVQSTATQVLDWILPNKVRWGLRKPSLHGELITFSRERRMVKLWFMDCICVCKKLLWYRFALTYTQMNTVQVICSIGFRQLFCRGIVIAEHILPWKSMVLKSVLNYLGISTIVQI